jgi:hypothetical protein
VTEPKAKYSDIVSDGGRDPRNKFDTAPSQREWKYDPMTGEPLIDGWPLYSGLPQREWQGLTYKERNDCLVEADPCEALLDHEAHELMRTVEAKLKEKNGG